MEDARGTVCPPLSNSYKQLAKLITDDVEPGAGFGISIGVSGSGDTAVIGGGGAYVFGRTDGTWTQRAKLTADDAAEYDHFGWSVAVSDSGETAVVGAEGDDHAGEESGSAYVFGCANGTWTQRAKLSADDAAEFDRFGWSVAVSGSGETVVIGASTDDTDAADDSGSAYVFGR